MRAADVDFGAYGRAFYLLVRHPQVMLAPLCAAIAQVLLFTIMPEGNGFFANINGGLTSLFAQLIASFGLAIATIVADAAWRYTRAPFDDAWEAARRHGGDIIMAALGVSFVVYVASLIGAIVPFGSIALGLVATFFMIYALPACAIGGVPGGASLQISVERARGALVPTLVLTIVYVFAFSIAPTLIFWLITPLLLALPHAIFESPAASQLIAAAVKTPVLGYLALVLAKTYDQVSYGRRFR